MVVSVGGNDVAMTPSIQTIINALGMMKFSSEADIAAGSTMFMSHFINLFHDQLKQYVEKVVSWTKPKKILVCMLYFLDEAPADSWASFALNHLEYNTRPQKLQAAMRTIFAKATSRIQIEGTEVVPIPLFEVLD